MTRPGSSARVVPLRPQAVPAPLAHAPERGELLEIREDGALVVRDARGACVDCDCLEPLALAGSLNPGDGVLFLPPADGLAGVVLGRIGRYRASPSARVTIEATEGLTLRCGDASVDLRADGKLMIRGEDVLLRARGTQRIKAGTVNIN